MNRYSRGRVHGRSCTLQRYISVYLPLLVDGSGDDLVISMSYTEHYYISR